MVIIIIVVIVVVILSTASHQALPLQLSQRLATWIAVNLPVSSPPGHLGQFTTPFTKLFTIWLDSWPHNHNILGEISL